MKTIDSAVKPGVRAFCHSNKNTRFKKYTHWEYLLYLSALAYLHCVSANTMLETEACLCEVMKNA